jgi:hypothetical protein
MGSIGFPNDTLVDKCLNTFMDGAGLANEVSDMVTQNEYLKVPLNLLLAVPCLGVVIGQNIYYNYFRKDGN